jgi:hypothetical protein
MNNYRDNATQRAIDFLIGSENISDLESRSTSFPQEEQSGHKELCRLGMVVQHETPSRLSVEASMVKVDSNMNLLSFKNVTTQKRFPRSYKSLLRNRFATAKVQDNNANWSSQIEIVLNKVAETLQKVINRNGQ